MAWVFQGNPKYFDIDSYLSRYTQLIYWRTPTHSRDIRPGDRAFIWRAGDHSGLVAIGTVVEKPTSTLKIKHPDALGSDLWYENNSNSSEPKTGIKLDEVRLSSAEYMVKRVSVASDPTLSSNSLITMPNKTVFRLSKHESEKLGKL